MEIYIVILLAALCAVLLIILLVKSKNNKNGDDTVKAESRILKEKIDSVQRANAEQMSLVRQEITTQLAQFSDMNTNIQHRVAEANLKSLDRLKQSVEERLDDVKKTVDEKLTESLKSGLETSFARVSEQLSELYKSMGEVKTLTSGVTDLKNILSNVKNRGTWGEVQLERLLGDFLAQGQYVKNAKINSEIVEFAIALPGEDGSVLLPIDSKFPMDRFFKVQEADGEERKAAKKELIRFISEEAKKINEKYIHPPKTTDFAIMFLPSESLYAEVLQENVLELLQNKWRILITGPTTLSALLTSFNTGFKTLAIREHSAHILDMLAAVRNEFGRFEEYIEKTKHSLAVAQGHLENVSKRSTKIQHKLDEVDSYEKLT